MPKTLVVELVKFAVFWLNAIPANGGVSITVSPRTLMTGLTVDYNTHCHIHFGAYAQTHEENFRANSLQARTLGTNTLGPVNNIQVGYYFMNLNTGQRIHSHFLCQTM